MERGNREFGFCSDTELAFFIRDRQRMFHDFMGFHFPENNGYASGQFGGHTAGFQQFFHVPAAGTEFTEIGLEDRIVFPLFRDQEEHRRIVIIEREQRECQGIAFFAK